MLVADGDGVAVRDRDRSALDRVGDGSVSDGTATGPASSDGDDTAGGAGRASSPPSRPGAVHPTISASPPTGTPHRAICATVGMSLRRSLCL